MTKGNLVLGVESSQRQNGLVVLADSDGRVLESRTGLVGTGELVAAVRELVAAAGGGLGRVVVGRGPGSYIGVRAGLALALGVAQGRRLPLHPVGALEVLAATCLPVPGDLLVIQAAGRGGAYGQRFTVAPAGEWQAATQSRLLRPHSPWPAEWEGVGWLLDQAELRPAAAAELLPLGAQRSRAAALAVVGGLSDAISGYHLLSADYGVSPGDLR